MKRTALSAALLGTFLCVLVPAGPAHATSFNFNTLADNANSAAVTTYMNGLLGAGQSVVVTGATASKTYDGEGHVIGPGGVPVTLGTGDNGVAHGGANDTFLDTFNSNLIQMLFTGLTVNDISFDYEIFPDNSCTSVSNCSGGVPDFTFRTSTNNFVTSTLVHTALALFPVDPNDVSPLSINETTAQLGPQTFSAVLGPGVTGLRFVDWPPTIGIDNLCINCQPSSTTTTATTTSSTSTSGATPEPTLLTLMGLGVTAMVRRRRRSLQGS